MKAAALNALEEQGVGALASRLVGGQRSTHHILEDKLASFLGVESVLTLVSGYLSIRPRPNSAIIAVANGALESLARALALELAPVRVNCVSPGIIDTPIRAAMPEAARLDMLAKTAASLPVGRVGLGEDIAQQILAFMTIGFATGSIVYLDGGGLVT